MPSRREKLEAMLQTSPDDVFLRYGLALELDKEGEHEASLTMLSSLIDQQPPYIPAYFMSGQQLTRLGRVEQARDVLRAGIDEARRQQDHHAAGEMSEFLASLGQFGE